MRDLPKLKFIILLQKPADGKQIAAYKYLAVVHKSTL
jgi:hypothetical protein